MLYYCVLIYMQVRMRKTNNIIKHEDLRLTFPSMMLFHTSRDYLALLFEVSLKKINTISENIL